MKGELFQCPCLFTISPYEYPKGSVRIFIQKELIKKNLHIHDLCVPKPSLFITCIYFLVYFRYIFMLVCYNFF